MTERERLIELMTQAENEELGLLEFEKKILADYLLASGVIVPPCKVGDTVYAKKACFYLLRVTRIKPTDIIPCKIIAIKQTKREKLMLLKPPIEESYGMRSANGWFAFSTVGKTVFLTKEEAEKALSK